MGGDKERKGGMSVCLERARAGDVWGRSELSKESLRNVQGPDGAKTPPGTAECEQQEGESVSAENIESPERLKSGLLDRNSVGRQEIGILKMKSGF